MHGTVSLRIQHTFTRVTALIAAFVLCLLVSDAPANWPADRGGPGKTNSRSTFRAVEPPLSLRGQYRSPVGGQMLTMLSDDARLYVHQQALITAMSYVHQPDDLEPFESQQADWVYNAFETYEDDNILRQFMSPAALVSNMVVFTEERISVDDNTRRLVLMGLDSATGELAWEADLGSGMNPSMIPLGNSVIVTFSSADLDTFNAPRIARATPGSTDSPLIRDLEPGPDGPTSALDIRAGGAGTIFMSLSNRIFAFDANTLDYRWTYLPTEAAHGEGHSGSVRDMIFNNGMLTILMSSHHLYALGANGELQWKTDLATPEECGNIAFLSATASALFVSALCDDILVSVNPATGDELWRTTTLSHFGAPPMIHGSNIYISALSIGDFFALPLLAVYDINTGAEVQLLETESGAPAFLRFAFSRDMLYGLQLPLFGGSATIRAYEEEPAALDVVIVDPPEAECGIPAGTPIPMSVSATNLGPGVATNVRVEVDFFGTMVELEPLPPPGVEARVETYISRIVYTVPSMEPMESIDLPFTLTGALEGSLLIRPKIESDRRNPLAGAERDRAEIYILGPVAEGLELAITGVEYNQGIQDLDNSIPLVGEKPTLVRVYTQSNAIVGGVGARLFLTGTVQSRSGGETRWFEDYPVAPLEDCRTITPDQGPRSSLRSTFNFMLPPEFTEGIPLGPVEVRIELDPDNVIPVMDRAALVYEETLDFTTVPPICLVTFPVKTLDMNEDELIPSAQIPDTIIERAKTLLPASRIRVFPRSHVISTAFTSGPYEFDSGGSTNTWRVLAKLMVQAATSSDPFACAISDGSTHYTGIVGEDVLTTGGGNPFAGYANLPGSSLIFRVHDEAGTGSDRPYAGRTLAHELGHNFFRFHVDCGDPDGAFSNYPYHGCQLGPLSESAFYGADLFDHQSPELIVPIPPDSPRTLSDLMSYAADRWISDYTWMGIYNRLGGGKHAQGHHHDTPSAESGTEWLNARRGSSGKEIVVVAGVVPDGEAEIVQILPVSDGVVPSEKRVELAEGMFRATRQESIYAFELLDSDGGVLLSVPAEVRVGEDFGPRVEKMIALLPDHDELETIRLVQNATEVLDESTRSASAPEIELLKPESGDVFNQTIEIAWTASDPDGDPLLAMIQYSVDNGTSWETVAIDVADSPHVIEAENLSGSLGSARIRIIVSDGFNATEATSDAFTVELRDPQATINRPADGETFALGEPILASGSAFDPEDGFLDGDALRWDLAGHDEVGTGESLLLTGLPSGTHMLVLTAEDSDGNTASDHVLIHVAPAPATGLDVVGVLLGLDQPSGDIDLDRNRDEIIDSADLLELGG